MPPGLTVLSAKRSIIWSAVRLAGWQQTAWCRCSIVWPPDEHSDTWASGTGKHADLGAELEQVGHTNSMGLILGVEGLHLGPGTRYGHILGP